MSVDRKCCRNLTVTRSRRSGGSELELRLHFACARNQLSIVEELLTRAAGLRAIITQPVELEWDTMQVRREESIQVGLEYVEVDDESYYFTYDLGGQNMVEYLVEYPSVYEEEIPVYETRVYYETESYVKHTIQHSAPIYVAAEYGNISIVSGIYPNTENAI